MPETLLLKLRDVLQTHSPDFIVLRDKKNAHYRDLAAAFLSLAAAFPKTRFMLHSDLSCALSLRPFGIHLTASQAHLIAPARKEGLFVVISTHTPKEAQQAKAQQADAITYSPLFVTPGKGEPLGLEKLKELRDTIDLPVIALGGILGADQIHAVENAGADGFASIRYFI